MLATPIQALAAAITGTDVHGAPPTPATSIVMGTVTMPSPAIAVSIGGKAAVPAQRLSGPTLNAGDLVAVAVIGNQLLVLGRVGP